MYPLVRVPLPLSTLVAASTTTGNVDVCVEVVDANVADDYYSRTGNILFCLISFDALVLVTTGYILESSLDVIELLFNVALVPLMFTLLYY